MKQLSLFDEIEHKESSKSNDLLNSLVEEILNTAAPKCFNINHGTASEREIFIYKECLGFLDLIKHSVMPVKEIKRLWDESLLAYK